MVSPTISALRGPMAARITISTSATAVSTLLSSSSSISSTISDWSMMVVISSPSGISAAASSSRPCTWSMVAMMLAPARLEISSTSAGWPSMRAKPSGSL